MTRISAPTILLILVSLLRASPAAAQFGAKLVGMGDSLGQGVQSSDASEATQPYSFHNLIAWRMGAPFPLPLIRTGTFGVVGETDGRTRRDPSVRALNLAVSGADVHSILYDAATATDVSQIDSETELVLFPEIGSQMDIAERLRPEYVICWIGNNDALGAALAWNRLDASQLTPVSDFTTDFTTLVERLDATGSKAVFGTIPDVTGIGFLLTRQEVIAYLGTDYGMAEGSLTTVMAMMLVKLGLMSGSVFTNPAYVLDPAEQAIIRTHTGTLNGIIRSTVAAHGMALVDTAFMFDYLSRNGLQIFGKRLTTRFLGGLFSLDGVHPSNIGHAILAIFFIDALNTRYGANIPQLDTASLHFLTATDPFIDKDGDGRVMGRSGAGLLEFAFRLIGISGDTNDGGL